MSGSSERVEENVKGGFRKILKIYILISEHKLMDQKAFSRVLKENFSKKFECHFHGKFRTFRFILRDFWEWFWFLINLERKLRKTHWGFFHEKWIEIQLSINQLNVIFLKIALHTACVKFLLLLIALITFRTTWIE